MRSTPATGVRVALALALASLLFFAPPAQPTQGGGTTYTVNSIDDGDDGICGPPVVFNCTLREAIHLANDNPDPGPHTIRFDILGAGPHTITPDTPLPTIQVPMIIDGFTEPGAMANTNPTSQGLSAIYRIILNGASAGALARGVHDGHSHYD